MWTRILNWILLFGPPLWKVIKFAWKVYNETRSMTKTKNAVVEYRRENVEKKRTVKDPQEEDP